jgi:hypothetical protein
VGVNGGGSEIISTDPLLLAKERLGAGLIMVGDSVDDMACAARANAASVLLLNEDNAHVIEQQPPDLLIRRLDELIEILEQGFVGRNLQTDSWGIAEERDCTHEDEGQRMDSLINDQTHSSFGYAQLHSLYQAEKYQNFILLGLCARHEKKIEVGLLSKTTLVEWRFQ